MEEITINLKSKDKKDMSHIELFADRIINGGGGFKSMERAEWAIYPDREVGIAEFVIRCLANPECDGSERVLQSIINRRDELKNIEPV